MTAGDLVMAGLKEYSGSPFDSLASAYDAWFEEEGKLIFAIEVSAFRKVLPLLPKPWLEVGVGSGRFAQALGIDAGIDPSVKLLDMAKRRGITVLRARGEEQVFDQEAFGTVFFIATLCFVDSPSAVFREAYRILKPEGKVVLGLVLRESPWGKFYQSKKTEGHRFYKYATFYSYQEVEGLLTASGFTIEKVSSTLFQKPGEVKEAEVLKDGFSVEAGFTVIVAGKVPGSKDRVAS
jgi:SAM-dependent methyltransferase